MGLPLNKGLNTGLVIETSGGIVGFRTGAYPGTQTTTGLSAQDWTHIAVTYSNSGNRADVRIYFDGVAQQLDSTSPGVVNDASNNLVLGSDRGTRRYFDGKIDDLIIYDRALSDAEIDAIYRSEEVTTCTDNDGDNYGDGCANGNDCDDNNAAKFPGNPEVCDNIDNNCDGSIDEGVLQQCGTTNVGVCEFGTQTCTGGSWGSCVGSVGPGTEVCDATSLDENCDGQNNEGCSCSSGQTMDCYAGTPCAGKQTCTTAGTWEVCDGVQPSISDQCGDNVDNDCDGTVDNGCWKIDNNGEKSLLSKIRDKTLSFKIVIGAEAATSDSVGGVDSAGKLGLTDSILDNVDYTNQNIIIIGGPCANKAAAEFMDVPHLYAAAGCENTIESGGIISIKQSGTNVKVLVAGRDAIDTRRAARVIARHIEFSDLLAVYDLTIPPGTDLNDIALS